MLLDSDVDIDKIQGVASELRNCIKSIDWDLEDLEQTISILFHALHMLEVHVRCSQDLEFGFTLGRVQCYLATKYSHSSRLSDCPVFDCLKYAKA